MKSEEEVLLFGDHERLAKVNSNYLFQNILTKLRYNCRREIVGIFTCV